VPARCVSSLRAAEERRTGFVTFPARIHEVHTLMRRGVPFTTALTLWMFGFQRLFVRRCEWLRLMPNEGCLPHTSQTAAMTRPLLRTDFRGFRNRTTRLASW
jgi:hypothetical protein